MRQLGQSVGLTNNYFIILNEDNYLVWMFLNSKEKTYLLMQILKYDC